MNKRIIIGEQYLLKFPPGMRKRLQDRADQNGRSLAAEMIRALEDHLNRPSILDRLDRIERKLGIVETVRAVG
jgi:hypothetical protein